MVEYDPIHSHCSCSKWNTDYCDYYDPVLWMEGVGMLSYVHQASICA